MEGISGTLTFLMTDVEGSTALWEARPDLMAQAMARHEAIADALVAEFGGALHKRRGEGDSLFITFARPLAAVRCAAAMQRAWLSEPWPQPTPIKVRMALRTGDVELRDGDFYGSTVNRCARMRAAAHGGQILLCAATSELTRRDLDGGLSTIHLGRHALRDIQEPENLFQLAGPDLPVDFPPLRSETRTRHNLPAHLTSFLGRDREMAHLNELLAESRLVTVLGPGGCGKTRLAIEFGRAHLEEYEDGVWFIPLADSSRADDLRFCLAAALMAHEAIDLEPAKFKQKLGALRALVILDNCEHLLPDLILPIRELLADAPNVRWLATSRQAIGLVDERALPLRPFAVEADTAGDSPAVRLFWDRARAKNPRLTWSSEVSEAVRRICARLDGLPLAIEQVASYSGALSPQQIAERLDDRLRMLRFPKGATEDRHQTMQAAIEWSLELLDPTQRQLCAALSVFAGGWTLEAAEAVCESPEIDVFIGLSELVDRSLVLLVDRPNGAHRYRFLETVREFLAAEDPPSDALRERHFNYVLQLAGRLDAHLDGPAEAAALDDLASELENLRVALGFGFERRIPEVRNLAHAVRRLWMRRGLFDEAYGWLKRASALAPEAVDVLGAKLENSLGAFAWRLGKVDESIAAYERSLNLWQAVGPTADTSGVLNNLGIAYETLGDYDRARTYFQAGIDHYRQFGDMTGLARVLLNLGHCELMSGQLQEAERLSRTALEHFDAYGMNSLRVYAGANLAMAKWLQGHRREAIDLYRDIIEQIIEIKDEIATALVCIDIATMSVEWEINEQGAIALASGQSIMQRLRTASTKDEMAHQAFLAKILEERLGTTEYRRFVQAGTYLTWEELVDRMRSWFAALSNVHARG